jgi:hypothetical protein
MEDSLVDVTRRYSTFPSTNKPRTRERILRAGNEFFWALCVRVRLPNMHWCRPAFKYHPVCVGGGWVVFCVGEGVADMYRICQGFPYKPDKHLRFWETLAHPRRRQEGGGDAC